MKLAGPLLNCISKISKSIALLTAIFLLCATFDNVPDNPELFSRSSGSSVVVQLAHHQLPGSIGAISAAGQTLQSPMVLRQGTSDVLREPLPSWAAKALHQAADSSPPAA